MKELNNFRKFLAEGQINKTKLIKENASQLPKEDDKMEEGPIQDFLSRQLPEEWPGSWTGDYKTGNFTAPYKHIMHATDQEDVEDYFYEEEEMINQLPTEWVKVEEYTTGAHNGIDFMVMNFAKYVPGEGIYVAATTDEIGGLNENELLNEGLDVTIASRKISFSDKEVDYIQSIHREGTQDKFSPYGIVADVRGKGGQGKSGSIAMITNFEEWMGDDSGKVKAEIKLLNGLDSEGVVIPNLLMIKKDSLNAVINRLKSEYENQLRSQELKLSSLKGI